MAKRPRTRGKLPSTPSRPPRRGGSCRNASEAKFTSPSKRRAWAPKSKVKSAKTPRSGSPRYRRYQSVRTRGGAGGSSLVRVWRSGPGMASPPGNGVLDVPLGPGAEVAPAGMGIASAFGSTSAAKGSGSPVGAGAPEDAPLPAGEAGGGDAACSARPSARFSSPEYSATWGSPGESRAAFRCGTAAAKRPRAISVRPSSARTAGLGPSRRSAFSSRPSAASVSPASRSWRAELAIGFWAEAEADRHTATAMQTDDTSRVITRVLTHRADFYNCTSAAVSIAQQSDHSVKSGLGRRASYGAAV